MIDIQIVLNRLDSALMEIQRIEFSYTFSDASVQAAREARKSVEELIKNIKAHE